MHLAQSRSFIRILTMLATVVCGGCGTLSAKGGVADRFVGGANNAAVIAAPDSVVAWRTVGSLHDYQKQTNSNPWALILAPNPNQYQEYTNGDLVMKGSQVYTNGYVLVNDHVYTNGDPALITDHWSIEDYYTKAGRGTPVPAEIAAQLTALLLDKHTYRGTNGDDVFMGLPDCEYEPGVVITFAKGDRAVDAYFCFQCDVLIIRYDKDPNKTPPFASTEAPIGYAREELLQVMKKIFPNDPQIQSLTNTNDEPPLPGTPLRFGGFLMVDPARR